MKLFRTLVVVLALSGSVYAGVIQNGVVQPPPPPTPVTTETTPLSEPAETEAIEQTPTVTELFLTVVSILGLI
jgi:hypothetical protein